MISRPPGGTGAGRAVAILLIFDGRAGAEAPRAGLSEAPADIDALGFAPRLNRGCADELNTLEQVQVDAPRPGRHEVLVRGPRAGGAPQRFTLVWSQGCAWDISEVTP